MKLVIGVFFLLCAVSAFGQGSAGYISSQAMPTHFQENPLHASNHDMAAEQSLVSWGRDPYHYEQGEQPVWQFGQLPTTKPLGDVARAVRKERLTAKRAEFVWEN
jgi:hypothetical protein